VSAHKIINYFLPYYLIKRNLFINQLFLDKKLSKNQGCVGYVAPDCKAFTARMAAAPLPPYAWLKQVEWFCPCFAARCGRILQGRSASPQAYGLVRLTPYLLPLRAMHNRSEARKWPRLVQAAIGSRHALG